MLARRRPERRHPIAAMRTPARRTSHGAHARRRRGADVRALGASTVEFAVTLPLLAVLTIALCGVVLLARDVVLAQGAAREGARAAAVSGDQSLAATAARAALPAGRSATISVSRPGPDRVKVRVRLVLPLPYARPLPVSAEAVAAVEPGEPPPAADARSWSPEAAP
jgi:TadE-like protein